MGTRPEMGTIWKSGQYAVPPFSQPLHVDCNVEYDLGNLSKIPKKSKLILSKDLLLMIAPSEFHTLRRPGT